MDQLDPGQEVLHQGWLIKSPPTKLWRARWRRRWFILCHGREFPRSYFLEYYTDRQYKKLKGRIELDQCEQVDAGIRFENCKQKYQHVFSIKTPKRKYYLAPETGEDMDKWVKAICHVCGLKPFAQHHEYTYRTLQSMPRISLPVTSPKRTSSGPYIPLSECISGRPLRETSLSSASPPDQEYYDAPRKLAPSPSKSSPSTDEESTFTDDESIASSIKWDEFSTSTLSKEEISACRVEKRFGKLSVTDTSTSLDTTESHVPPRPPKTSQLSVDNRDADDIDDDYDDSNSTISNITITDEFYDFPRVHRLHSGEIQTNVPSSTHIYSNAASTVLENTANSSIFVQDLKKEVVSEDGHSADQETFESAANTTHSFNSSNRIENTQNEDESVGKIDDVTTIFNNEVYSSAAECKSEISCSKEQCDINEDSNS